jgi:erythromycin esterase
VALRAVAWVLPCWLALPTTPAVAQDAHAEHVAWLAEHATRVRTLDPADEDDADLLPLVEAIGDARVVVLGEATHEDGATFRAKCRMVRFLHERMGFDVLAWEAGFLDCERMSAALRGDGPLQAAKQRMKRNGWDASAECHGVFEYARATWDTDRPLEMTGFDGGSQPHGPGHVRALVASLVERVPRLGGADDVEAVHALARRAYGYMSAEHGKVSEDVRARERGAAERLLARLEERPSGAVRRFGPRERDAAAEALRTLLVSERGAWLGGQAMLTGDGAFTLRHNAERDAKMGGMLVWLANERYRGRKLVLWCATAHMIRDLAGIEPLEDGWSYEGIEQMGDHVAAALGRDVYVIAFTAHGGEIGTRFAEGDERESSILPIEPAPPEGSFEALCHATGAGQLFVDLRHLPEGHWLAQEPVARPLAYGRTRTRWPEDVDAFFFIDVMTPDRLLPESR